MVPNSPFDALGSHAPGVRDLVIEVVQSRHALSADAHEAAATRYAMGFGSQWRDLLDDTRDAFQDRGYQSHKLTPAGYKIPIVDDCLVYVWRVPATADAIDGFASSKTRVNGFFTPPNLALFDFNFLDGDEPAPDDVEAAEFEHIVTAIGDTMPVVLVMVHSSPRQLHSIEWAVAELTAGKVQLHGKEVIWAPAFSLDDDAAVAVDAFDTGTPIVPAVELQKLDRPSDA